MKRLAALVASLLAVAGCSHPTAPAREGDAARAAQAKAALEGVTKDPTSAKLSAN